MINSPFNETPTVKFLKSNTTLETLAGRGEGRESLVKISKKERRGYDGQKAGAAVIYAKQRLRNTLICLTAT